MEDDCSTEEEEEHEEDMRADEEVEEHVLAGEDIGSSMEPTNSEDED